LPFNTGRALLDARTAEVWRKLTQYALRSLGARDLGYASSWAVDSSTAVAAWPAVMPAATAVRRTTTMWPRTRWAATMRRAGC
jgi:hypothetical protein